MSQGPDPKEALAALERLVHRHHLLSEDEARRAARLITNDPGFEFPPPKAAPGGEGTPQPPPQKAGGQPKPGGNGSGEGGAEGGTEGGTPAAGGSAEGGSGQGSAEGGPAP